MTFETHYECEFEDTLVMVGDHAALGRWAPERGVQMEWGTGHVWRAEALLPPGATVQFKLVLQRKDGTIVWSPGINAGLEVPEYRRTYTIAVNIPWGAAAEIRRPFSKGRESAEVREAELETERLTQLIGDISNLQSTMPQGLIEANLKGFAEILGALDTAADAELAASSLAVDTALMDLRDVLDVVENGAPAIDPLSPEALAADVKVAQAANTALEAVRMFEASSNKLLGPGAEGGKAPVKQLEG